jgi:hypothetical protein
VYRVIVALRNFLLRVVRRMVPARVAMFDMFTGVWHTQMIYAAARLAIADTLASGPKTASEIAAACDADADAVGRLMRALTSVGVFARRSDGRFELNRLGLTLQSGRSDSMRDIVMFLGSRHSMLGWAHFVDAIRSGKNGFELAHGKPVFDYLAEHPEDDAIFNGGMVCMTELDAPALVRGFDYSKFRTLCDVGGGRGLLLAAILSENPALEGVLFDVARVIEKAPAVFDAWGVASRATAVAGSFFEDVPRRCDAYILKEILHDWDDARCLTILEACRRAMKRGAALLVMEMIVVDDDEPHPGKLLDMEMLDTTMEGRQRNAEELARLFERSGFRLVRVVELPSPTSIVEAIAV